LSDSWNALFPPGRFLKRYNEDVNSNWWTEVSKQVAFDKVSHAFRSRGRPKIDKNAAAAASMQRHQQLSAYPAMAMHPHGHHPHAHHPHYGMPMGQFGMMAAMGRGFNPMFRGFMPPQQQQVSGPTGSGQSQQQGDPSNNGEGGGQGGEGGQQDGGGDSAGQGGPQPGQYPPEMEQMFLENQRRAAAFGFGHPAAAAALYGAGFAGPGDGGFGFPPGGYPPHGGPPPPPPHHHHHPHPHQQQHHHPGMTPAPGDAPGQGSSGEHGGGGESKDPPAQGGGSGGGNNNSEGTPTGGGRDNGAAGQQQQQGQGDSGQQQQQRGAWQGEGATRAPMGSSQGEGDMTV
jgi:hypothetical protein